METANRSPWIALLLVQRAVSLVFLVGSIAFPFYILYRHGLSVLPVYDRGGNVIGHANYFVLSLGFSAFALLISWLCYKAAQRSLQQLRSGK
ncbi:hypothetical protein [Cognatiluteimonas weifangensis]|uniref:hypothetical protein n=1 Tax=Cognatiluteimonas weifangensis TaxID=2303539 RepID=UPI0011C10C6B|nr:hypothetical protein [Luteimonas weifangensis]